MDPDRLRADLHAIGQKLHTDFFCLQGGEPLLHPKILEMIEVASTSGIAEKYGILTNGRLLPEMNDEFWKACERNGLELRVTVYGNLPESTLEIIRSRAGKFVKARAILSRLNVFTKVLGNFTNGESFHACRWKACHTVHEGRFYICPLSAFWPKRFMDLPPDVDGFPIDGTSESDLEAFINRTTPMNACRRCTGEQASSVGWHQVENEEQWIRESTA